MNFTQPKQNLIACFKLFNSLEGFSKSLFRLILHYSFVMPKLLLSLFFCSFFIQTKAGEATEIKNQKYDRTLGYRPDEVIHYYEPTPTTKLGLHVFYPENHKSNDERTCIVFFYGGGWISGDPSQFYSYCKYFSSRGIIAISAQYRNAKLNNVIPRECVEDGREAIRYIREHSKELGIDPKKIIAGGGSAGGHVAAAIAMCTSIDAKPKSKTGSIPNGLILLNPVYHNGPKGGYGYGRVKEYWKAFSPFHNIQKGQPKTICFFGTEDKFVPLSTIEAFQNEMDNVGNDCKTHLYEGQHHGFFNIPKGGREIFEDVLTKIDAFLVKNHFLTGENKVNLWTTKAIIHFDELKKKSNHK